MAAIKKVEDTVTPDLVRISRDLQQLPGRAYKVFVSETPIRSGNARSRTKLVGNRVIEADYPYAERLDRGYSRQSPDGMTKPTVDFLRKELARIMR